MTVPGKFISVEGIEGVGKTSNIEVIVNLIETAGIEVLTTREPGGTPLAEEVRALLVEHRDESMPEITELLLMFAARSLNVNNVIRPALQAGRWVVCDRFTDSSRAYQGGGRGLSMETIETLAEWTHGDCWPDLTLLLDAPVDIGRSRAHGRGAPDRIEREKIAFFERVRACYLQLAANEPDRIRIVDTARSLHDVKREVSTIVRQLIAAN